jgi:hypothetical protein
MSSFVIIPSETSAVNRGGHVAQSFVSAGLPADWGMVGAFQKVDPMIGIPSWCGCQSMEKQTVSFIRGSLGVVPSRTLRDGAVALWPKQNYFR